MSQRTEIEQAVVAQFLGRWFGADYAPEEISDAEKAVITRIVKYVEEKLLLAKRTTYVLGLALDFTMAAQKLSEFDDEANEFREESGSGCPLCTLPTAYIHHREERQHADPHLQAQKQGEAGGHSGG